MLKEEQTDNLGQEFCYIPAGSFLGGPGHDEELMIQAPFYLGKYPVTVSLFMAFLSDARYAYPAEDLRKLQQVSSMHNCPVVNVSWQDAKEFCRWLRRKTGHYYSLPQMDEWEKAARGEDGRIYPWGHEEPMMEQAFFGQAAVGCTSPVGSRPSGASPYGRQDMSGNVSEWCVDCFTDEREPHVLKGGSWQNGVEEMDCGTRLFSHPPDLRRTYMGMRLLYLPGHMYEDYIQAYENA